MKVRISKIETLLVLLCILFQCSFFHLVPANYMARLMTIFIIVTWVVSMIISRLKSYANIYILNVVIFVFILQGLYTIFSGKQSLSDYCSAIYLMLAVLLFKPILDIFKRENTINNLLDSICFLMIIYMTIIIVNALTRNLSGMPLISNTYFLQVAGTRNGRMRLTLFSPFTLLIPIYAFGRLLGGSRKILHFFALILTSIALVYVEQTRMMEATFVITCILMISLKISNIKYKIIIYLICIAILVGSLLFGNLSFYSNAFIQSFSTKSGENSVSTLNRIYEIQIAFHDWIKNPIFGTGILNKYKIEKIYNGYRLLYNHTDLGLYGMISYMGISSVFLFIIPVNRYIKMAFRIPKKKRSCTECYIYIGILSYIVVSSVTIIITDNVRIFAWPFALAILEFYKEYLKDSGLES